MERLRTKAQEYLNRLANPAPTQQPVTSNPGPIGPGGQNLLLKQKPLEHLDQSQFQWLPPGNKVLSKEYFFFYETEISGAKKNFKNLFLLITVFFLLKIIRTFIVTYK